MGNSIAKLFGIEKEEQGLITILLIQSVFLGIFFGVFNITAHSLFLAKFDETIMARAYILSGLAGSGLTYLYTLLQSKLRFTGFSIMNLGFILSVSLILWFLISLYPENWVIFAFFIMLGPLNLLALLGFYGTTGRVFTLRQGKRLFGIIDTGLVIGVIVSSFGIPGLLSLNFSTYDIILFSSGSILVALIIQSVISNRYKGLILASAGKEKDNSGISVFRKDNYIRTMGLFIALSVVVMFFVQYSFMAVTRERYPEEQEMARFLGFFEGSMMVFTLLIKTFLFSYLIKNHGLKITLIVGPVLIALFTLIAALLGITRGYLPGTAGFMIFFLVLAISRLFSKALKDSVETPAFKVLYQTLADNVRFRVQSAIDGTINEIAALSSGLLLTGLGVLAFVKLIHFSWVLLGLVVIWIMSGVKLYNEYRNSVKKSLEKIDEGGGGREADEIPESSVIGRGILLQNDYYSFIEAGDIMDADRRTSLFKLIVRRCSVTLDPAMLPALKKITMQGDSGLKEEAAGIIERIEESLKDISQFASSDIIASLEEIIDKRKFVKNLVASGRQLLLTDILRLIRDNDMEVKRQAIYLIGRSRVTDMIPELCDCLSLPEISRDAYSVLRSFGDTAFSALGAAFFRSSGSTETRILIVRLFGESGVAEASEFLLPRLWAVHKQIRKEALTGLLKCGYIPDDITKDRLVQEVLDTIGLLTWNISATVSIKERGDDNLARVMADESLWWQNFLFDLLSLIYDKQSFDKIRENLALETVESVNFALEMIDIVVDDSVKPRLTALLDDVSEEDKLKTLFQFYPGNIPAYPELVEDLINMDYNHISVWTKSVALRSLYQFESPSDTDFIIALLFSPNQILREEAVRYLREKYRDVYDYCAYRIPEGFRSHLAKVLSNEIDEGDEIYNKVLILSGFFRGVNRDKLIPMAMRLVRGKPGMTFPDDANLILFRTATGGDDEGDIRVRWNECGVDNLPQEWPADNDRVYTLGTDQLAEAVFINPGFASSIISVIDKNLK